MPLSVGLFLILSAFLMGLVLGSKIVSRRAYTEGYGDGYADARTIPIGHLKSFDFGSIGFNGMIQLEDDVTLVDDPKETL